VVRGAVEIAAACGVPGVSLIKTALDEVVDAPKIKELPERYRQLKEEDKRVEGIPGWNPLPSPEMSHYSCLFVQVILFSLSLLPLGNQ
jgi:hypothetical protein